MKRSSTALSLLTAIALGGMSTAVPAEELYVIRDGKLNKESLDWPDVDFEKHPFWKDWAHCGGETVDGLFVVPKQVGSRKNHARFTTAKSALGDCEFKVVFSCTPDGWPPRRLPARPAGSVSQSIVAGKVLPRFEAGTSACVAIEPMSYRNVLFWLVL